MWFLSCLHLAIFTQCSVTHWGHPYLSMVLRIYFCFLLLYKCWSLSASLFLQGERVKFVNVWIIYFCVLWAGVFSTLCHHINTVDFTVYVIQHFNTPFHTATVTPYTKIDDALTQPPFLDWSQDHLDALLSLTLLLCWQQKKIIVPPLTRRVR